MIYRDRHLFHKMEVLYEISTVWNSNFLSYKLILRFLKECMFIHTCSLPNITLNIIKSEDTEWQVTFSGGFVSVHYLLMDQNTESALIINWWMRFPSLQHQKLPHLLLRLVASLHRHKYSFKYLQNWK